MKWLGAVFFSICLALMCNRLKCFCCCWWWWFFSFLLLHFVPIDIITIFWLTSKCYAVTFVIFTHNNQNYFINVCHTLTTPTTNSMHRGLKQYVLDSGPSKKKIIIIIFSNNWPRWTNLLISCLDFCGDTA